MTYEQGGKLSRPFEIPQKRPRLLKISFLQLLLLTRRQESWRESFSQFLSHRLPKLEDVVTGKAFVGISFNEISLCLEHSRKFKPDFVERFPVHDSLQRQKFQWVQVENRVQRLSQKILIFIVKGSHLTASARVRSWRIVLVEDVLLVFVIIGFATKTFQTLG